MADKSQTGKPQTSHKNYRSHAAGNDIYIDGNTVRKQKPLIEEPIQPKEPKKHNPKIRKNREKARYMNLGYVVFLAVALCVCGITFVDYIQLHMEIIKRTENISTMESELNKLKLSNDDEYNRIVSNINLEEIKRIAIEELGMIYAKEGQIIPYSNEGNDYMRKVTEE